MSIDAGDITVDTGGRGARPSRVVGLVGTIAIVMVAGALCGQTVPQPLNTAKQQSTAGRIQGTVFSSDSVPLAGARIVLFGTAQRGTVTSDAGDFRFESVPPGQYRLQVRRLGYAVEAFTVAVSPGDTTAIAIGGSAAKFTLTPPAGVSVDVYNVPSIRWQTSPCQIGTAVSACRLIATKVPYTVTEAMIVAASSEPREFVQACKGRIGRISHLEVVSGSTNAVPVRCS